MIIDLLDPDEQEFSQQSSESEDSPAAPGKMNQLRQLKIKIERCDKESSDNEGTLEAASS
jgi:hypothetical protein